MMNFDRIVVLENALNQEEILVKPAKIRGMISVNNGRDTRLTFWDGNSVLVSGSIPVVAYKLFSNANVGWVRVREMQATAAPMTEKI